MKHRTIAVIILMLATILALGCTVSRGPSARITPTATKTLRPVFTSTFTPAPTQVPTHTVEPTSTPLPTDTIIPPTETAAATATATALATEVPATDTPIPPTDTPQPVAPSHTPRPQPTNTPAPPTDTPRPQVDFRVVEQRLMSRQENEAQRHMILIRVVDGGGNPLHGLVVWDPNHPEQEAETGTKPEPYHAEYTFWNYDGYQLEVRSANSDRTKVLSTDVYKISIEDLIAAGYCTDAASCNPGELVQHFSWYVTFQRTW